MNLVGTSPSETRSRQAEAEKQSGLEPGYGSERSRLGNLEPKALREPGGSSGAAPAPPEKFPAVQPREEEPEDQRAAGQFRSESRPVGPIWRPGWKPTRK